MNIPLLTNEWQDWEAVVYKNGVKVDWYDPVDPDQHYEDEYNFFITHLSGDVYAVKKEQNNMVVYRVMDRP